jgi:citrate lyase subunit beta / citryl-CoA lyase
VNLPPIRSWLYAPGNNPKLLERVFGAGADAVILDLEDAVPPAEKAHARELVAGTVQGRAGATGPAVFVRVNHPDSGLTESEVRAVVGQGLDGIRVPKVETPETVHLIDRWISDAERQTGLPNGTVALICNLESAAGVWAAREIASASPRVLTVAFGTADFLRDVNGSLGPEALETLFARSHLVLAARVAGVRAPVDGVFTRLDDDAGLERTTRQSRGLGFFGRSALHPRQVPIINGIFTPSDAEVAAARDVVEAAASAEAAGSGALRLPNGDFVDVAIVRRAEATLQLAAALLRAADSRA